MKRQDIIKKNRQIKLRKQTIDVVKKVNVSAIIFSSVIALDQAVAHYKDDTPVVEARQTPSQFLNLISGYAKDVAKNNGLYASVMIAQAALESGWGNSHLASEYNNLFGIKGSYNGDSIKMNTLEDDGSGNYYQIQDGFRVYGSVKESLEDYAAVITGDNNPNSWRGQYYKGALVKNTTSYQDATAWLTGRYATDTRYGSKLNQLIEQYGLTTYDTVQPGSSKQILAPTPQPIASQGGSQETHTVKTGESVWGISQKYGMRMDQLRQMNNISGNFIYPGQVLIVAGNAATAKPNNPVTKPGTPTTKPGTTKSSPAKGSYTVQAGDSVWKISQKFGMTMSDLVKMNGIKNNFIVPGQVLKVSGSSQTPQPVNNGNHSQTPVVKPTPAPQQGNGGTGTHVVRAGESVWGISHKYGMSMDQLRQLNNIAGNYIYPGQSLRISGSVQSKPSPQPQQQSPAQVNPTPSQNTPAQPVAPTEYTPALTRGTYTIKAGDNLYRIAINHGMSLDHLLQLNGFANSSVAIFPGQTIKVAQ